MNDDLQRLQLLAMQRVGQPAMGRERAALAGRRNRGRRPLRPILEATKNRPARVADEPRMALAFFLRRMEGMSWNGAAADTAEEFGLQVKRKDGIVVSTRAAESKVERAAETWRAIVLVYLLGAFPGHVERLRELMRERRT